MSRSLRRRIVPIGSRHVHLWTGGTGPAVILIHGSPGNAWLVTPLAKRLMDRFSVYAVDSPGFGSSDSLPATVEHVAQLADAYGELLDSLGLGTVLVYGTHSGAAIGLELAHRHPTRVAGFVLEGVPIFTLEEQRPLLAPEYLVPLEPDVLGGHYARAWTRFHDQFVWFPWYQRNVAHLNEAPAGSAADIHLWVEMYFQAMRHEYRPAYRAVIRHGTAAVAAARNLAMPGVFLAERSDMLFGHLDRLPPLRTDQHIVRVMEPAEVPERIEAALCSLPVSSAGAMPPAADSRIDRGFADLPHGQLWVRAHTAGEGQPCLLLHDAPGAGRGLIDLYHALRAYGPVLLPDLPGCGESDPTLPGGGAPTLASFADAMAAMLRARADRPVHVYGVGFGAAVALELHSRHPDLVDRVTLTGLLRTDGAERRAMIGRLAPPIQLADDGSHWYRTWLMLRDSLVRWPWYSREPAALRRQPLALDPEQLHAWTCDVMRQWHSYYQFIDAVLDWSPAESLSRQGSRLTIAIDALHPLFTSDAEWAIAGTASLRLPDDPADRARVITAAGC